MDKKEKLAELWNSTKKLTEKAIEKGTPVAVNIGKRIKNGIEATLKDPNKVEPTDVIIDIEASTTD